MREVCRTWMHLTEIAGVHKCKINTEMLSEVYVPLFAHLQIFKLSLSPFLKKAKDTCRWCSRVDKAEGLV